MDISTLLAIWRLFSSTLKFLINGPSISFVIVSKDKRLIVTVTNHTGRTLTIHRVGFLLPYKGELFFDEISPNSLFDEPYVDLSDGQSHDFICLMSERLLNERYGITPDRYIAFVKDGSGKYFCSHNLFSRYMKLRRFKCKASE